MRFFGFALVAVLLVLKPHVTKAEGEPMPAGPPGPPSPPSTTPYQDDPNSPCGGCPTGLYCIQLWPPCPPPCEYSGNDHERVPGCVDEAIADNLPGFPSPPSPPGVTNQFDPNEPCGGCPAGEVCRLVCPPQQPCLPIPSCVEEEYRYMGK